MELALNYNQRRENKAGQKTTRVGGPKNSRYHLTGSENSGPENREVEIYGGRPMLPRVQ